MGHELDHWEPVRRAVWPLLDPVLRPFGGYSTGEVGRGSLAGYTYVGEEELEKALHEAGFTRNFVAALKHRTAPEGELDISEGSWAWRRHYFSTWQYHVTLFVVNGMTRVYAHKEYNWRVHPIKHLNAEDLESQEATRFVAGRLLNHGIKLKTDG